MDRKEVETVSSPSNATFRSKIHIVVDETDGLDATTRHLYVEVDTRLPRPEGPRAVAVDSEIAALLRETARAIYRLNPDLHEVKFEFCV